MTISFDFASPLSSSLLFPHFTQVRKHLKTHNFTPLIQWLLLTPKSVSLQQSFALLLQLTTISCCCVSRQFTSPTLNLLMSSSLSLKMLISHRSGSLVVSSLTPTRPLLLLSSPPLFNNSASFAFYPLSINLY